MPTTQPSGLASSLPSPKVIVAAAAALAVLAAAVLLLNPPTLHASGSSATVVSTAKTSLGRILVNSRGHTLYLFGKDRHGKSACSGQCATFWPPLIAKGKPAIAGGAKASLIGVIMRADGRRQVTYNHHPLYTFVKDKTKGQTKGEALSAFGSKWYAVSPGGAKVLPSLPGTAFRRTTPATTIPTTTAVRATAMGTSDLVIDGSRRLLIVAATIAAILGVWVGAADRSVSANAQAPAFRWLHPRQPPRDWKLARLPSGAATFGYPGTWRPIRTDPGTASIALIGQGHLIRGYLNATPRQGTETLANWPSFRIEHLRDDESSKDVRLIASAHGLRFRSGRGSCVIDSYRTSRTRYREIACLVAGTRTSSVIVGAAPAKTWAQQAGTIERAIASLRTD